MSELLTVKEIARMCRVHELTIRRHIAQGKLKAVRVGKSIRIRQEDVEAYLAEDRKPDAGEKDGIITESDPFLDLIGMIEDEEAADLSSNKYKYFPEAFSPR
jgi:excisionase family DNA binding protein